jgi:hypothetical protein
MSVHKLTGRLLPGEANQDLIEALEGLVERAKKGEITGLAWAGVTGNDHLINGWEGPGGTVFTIGASIMALNSRYAAFMMGDE